MARSGYVRGVKVDGTYKVVKALKQHFDKTVGAPDLVLSRMEIGYSAFYSLYVHEDLTKHHPTGQAKFLEQPMRQYGPRMVQMVKDKVGRGRSNYIEALHHAATWLLSKSKELVPVDTGFLKSSGYVKILKGGGLTRRQQLEARGFKFRTAPAHWSK